MQIKQTMNELVPALNELAEKYEFQQEMNQAIEKHTEFKLRLPFVGAFSTGKSTLINALLGDKLLGVQVTPETCLPTEIHYAEHESITIMNAQGRVSEISREQLKDQHFPITHVDDEYWIDIGLPTSVLADFSDLILVDMPGWESGISAHSQAIDSYVHRSGAYCLVVSAEEGALRQSIKHVLTELKLFNKPVILIISKCDKCLPDEIAAIEQHITQSVTDVLGVPPLQVLTVSARKKKLEGVLEAIGTINQASAAIYHNMVLADFIALFERMQNKMTILLNEDNLTLEQIKLSCDKVPQALNALKIQLSEVEQKIDTVVVSCIEVTKTNLKNMLTAQVNTLASAVRHGGSIESEIGNALRQSFLIAIEQDFKPKITQRLKALQNLGELAPTDISVTNQFESSLVAQNNTVFSQVITLVLTKVLTLIPVLKPFATVIHLMASIFTDQADRKIQDEQQREEAKHYVLDSLIPQVINQAEPTIISSFNDMASKVKQELNKESERKAADKQQALQTLQKELEQSQQADQVQRDIYQADFAKIQSVKQTISVVAV
jgi:GTPase Era involved in 16S rRNA processing